MPLMHKMRENTHIILFFLLVMFLLSMTIGGLVGGADITHLFGRRQDTIVSINGENISNKQYNDFRQQQIEAYRQQNQKEPEGYELQRLEDDIWESLVRDLLLKQFAEKMKIGVTTKEIAYHIYENPPEFLKSNPNFQDESGNFDANKYQAALDDERNDPFWNSIEMYLMGTIPFNKIYQEVMTSVFVTDEEVKQEFIKRNQRVKVKYIVFNSSNYKVDDAEITQKDIETYYNEHTENYKEDEKRKIQYVLFEVTPSSSDTSEVLYLVETLLDSINQGIDFTYLAENYSDDPASAKNGGDLGYIEKGSLREKSLEDTMFSANIGDIVAPIIAQQGVYIIKIEDKKIEDEKEKVKARQILLKVEPSHNTYEVVRDNANYFAEVAQEENFNQAVINEKATVDTTDFFTNNGLIPGLGVQKRMVDAIFHVKVGKTSRVHYIENRGYIIYQLIDIQKERTRPLNDVEQAIRNTVRREKQKKLAENAALQFREKIQVPEDFERLAGLDSLGMIETEFFTLNGYVRNIGRDANFIGAAFGLEIDELSSIVSGARGAYIIKMVEKQEVDVTTFNSQKESLRSELIQQKQRTAYNNWYTNLKESAKIKDYRYLFF